MERIYHLRRERVIPSQFVTRSIYHELVQGNPEIAIQMCERRPGPLTNILRVGIEHRNADEDTLKRVIRLSINGEKPKLTRYLHILGMLSGVAIYTGLLGTFLGMITSFGNLYEIEGQVGQSSEIASGISASLNHNSRWINGRTTNIRRLLLFQQQGTVVFNRVGKARYVFGPFSCR